MERGEPWRVHAVPAGANTRIEAEFMCALTMRVMVNPVIDPSAPGSVCERKDLEKFVREHGTSPFTGLPLSAAKLIPLPSLQRLIQSLFWSHVTVQPAKRPRTGPAPGEEHQHHQAAAAAAAELPPPALADPARAGAGPSGGGHAPPDALAAAVARAPAPAPSTAGATASPAPGAAGGSEAAAPRPEAAAPAAASARTEAAPPSAAAAPPPPVAAAAAAETAVAAPDAVTTPSALEAVSSTPPDGGASGPAAAPAVLPTGGSAQAPAAEPRPMAAPAAAAGSSAGQDGGSSAPATLEFRPFDLAPGYAVNANGHFTHASGREVRVSLPDEGVYGRAQQPFVRLTDARGKDRTTSARAVVAYCWVPGARELLLEGGAGGWLRRHPAAFIALRDNDARNLRAANLELRPAPGCGDGPATEHEAAANAKREGGSGDDGPAPEQAAAVEPGPKGRSDDDGDDAPALEQDSGSGSGARKRRHSSPGA